MVVVTYSHRLVCDGEFCQWLHGQPDKQTILSKLMHIKASSKDWKKVHNLILEPEASNCSDKIENRYLGAAFKIIGEPNFLGNYAQRVSKNIVFGIDLTNDTPFKCYLLTSPGKEKEYQENPHNQNIKNFEVISGQRAIRIIDSFYRAFVAARETQRN